MQWPPRPGPGLNDMNPNGLVAAASTTSHTSIPIRSQSCASSLTSAMLTERKMFSSSFVSSAASGGRDHVDVVDRALVEACGRLGRGLVDSADHLRGRSRREVLAARIDALGREGEVEVAARLQAADLLEQGTEDVAGRPRIRGRLEHDQVALAEVGADRAGGALDVGEVRLALDRQRRRHRDHDGVGVGDHGEVGGRGDRSRLDERLQLVGGDVPDVAFAAVDRVDDVLEHVDEHDLLARLGEGLGVRHADVAGADHGDVVAGVHAHPAGKGTEPPRCVLRRARRRRAEAARPACGRSQPPRRAARGRRRRARSRLPRRCRPIPSTVVSSRMALRTSRPLSGGRRSR